MLGSLAACLAGWPPPWLQCLYSSVSPYLLFMITFHEVRARAVCTRACVSVPRSSKRPKKPRAKKGRDLLAGPPENGCLLNKKVRHGRCLRRCRSATRVLRPVCSNKKRRPLVVRSQNIESKQCDVMITDATVFLTTLLS